MDKKAKTDDYFICPSCGAEVRGGAKFCRECGASDDLGWDEDGHWWEDELPTGYTPDDDFDYEDFIGREFPERLPPWSGRRWKNMAFGLLVVIVCAALLVWMLWPH